MHTLYKWVVETAMSSMTYISCLRDYIRVKGPQLLGNLIDNLVEVRTEALNTINRRGEIRKETQNSSNII